jgi:hypothetical protein
MKKLIGIVWFVALTLFCWWAAGCFVFSQSTSVTASITDTDGNTWNYGSVTATFSPGPVTSYVWAGGPIPNQVKGTMNGSGTFTISLPDNNTIQPSGTSWNISICPWASAPCVSKNFVVTGSSINLSTQLSAIATGPRFPATGGAYGYADTEVYPTPVPGGSYWNVNSLTPRCWTGTQWTSCSSSSGSLSGMTAGQIPVAASATTVTSSIPTTGSGNVVLSNNPAMNGIANSGSYTQTGTAANTFTGPTTATALSAQNLASIGPRYDVTQFGATGNGTTDDTAAIQAAFNACWNSGNAPYGGVVEFPGQRKYVISSTINIYDGCKIEGQEANPYGTAGPVQIVWNGGSVPQGTQYSVTGFTAESNNSTNLPCSGAICYTAAFPYIAAPGAVRRQQLYAIVVNASNNLSVNQWVMFSGCNLSGSAPDAGGLALNNKVGQIAQVSSTQFTVLVPSFAASLGAYSDSCTATTVNVGFASDQNAEANQEVKNITLMNNNGVNAATGGLGVGFYAGSRIDTGSRFYNTWLQNGYYFNYYIAGGGLNVEWDKGWRCDGGGVCIYWAMSGGSSPGGDGFSLANGTMASNGLTQPNTGLLEIDTGGGVGTVHATLRNIKVEPPIPVPSGSGVLYLIDYPNVNTLTANPQFQISMDNVWVENNPANPIPMIVMAPANDAALTLSVHNSGLGIETAAQRWVGLPKLARGDFSGQYGYVSDLEFNSSMRSAGFSGTYGTYSPVVAQALGDFQMSQLWQHKVFAPSLLESDTAFAALPNGTTLYKGQVIAPPVSWGANTLRYPLDVVYQSGTTGSPNGGNTTCTASSTGWVLTCSSATDLSFGQFLSFNGLTGLQIENINALNPGAVVVSLSASPGNVTTPQPLSFTPPLLGPEMQLPTKSAAAPSGSSTTYSQGDFIENSSASANGIAGWVNTSAGAPGSWAAIPLGDASGHLSLSQLANVTQTTVSCSTSGSVTFSEPFQGTSYKKVVIYANACTGTASYTYPTAFTNTPVGENNDIFGGFTATTTSVTITATAVTGFAFLEGY